MVLLITESEASINCFGTSWVAEFGVAVQVGNTTNVVAPFTPKLPDNVVAPTTTKLPLSVRLDVVVLVVVIAAAPFKADDILLGLVRLGLYLAGIDPFASNMKLVQVDIYIIHTYLKFSQYL